MRFINRITFCKPRFYFHSIIEFKQSLTDTVTHTVPTGAFSRNGTDRTIVIHLTTKIQNLFPAVQSLCSACAFRTCATAGTTGSQTNHHQTCCQKKCCSFFHNLFFLSLFVHKAVRFIARKRKGRMLCIRPETLL